MRSIDLIRTALESKRVEGKSGTASVRVLAAGCGWRAVDVVCTSGPTDRVFEEQRTFVSVAVVLAGTFTYRSSREHVALLPGSMLLGNAGECFECGHAYGEGDRCLAFHFDPDFFDSIRSEIAAGAQRPLFARDRLPSMPSLTSIWAASELFASGHEIPDIEELALEAAALAVTAGGLERNRSREPRSHQLRRVSEAIRFISGNLDQALSLEMLASYARMSRFGFVRCFKRITGSTPHSYIRSKRICEAAVRLRTTRQPIANIALDVGFADLSTFNAAFRAMIGWTPSAYRSGCRLIT
jgi:AraC-like DNA-binding protein